MLQHLLSDCWLSVLAMTISGMWAQILAQLLCAIYPAMYRVRFSPFILSAANSFWRCIVVQRT